MENEEIMWRLSQAPEDMQSVLNRSISHSPTSSASSTPEPTRRRRSPHPQSPRSPRTSGSDIDRFTQRSPRASGVGNRSSWRSSSDAYSPRSSGSDFDRFGSPRNGDSGSCGDASAVMSTSTQSEPSQSNTTQVNTNLKRSGTYELLNEEAEINGGCSPTKSPTKQTDV